MRYMLIALVLLGAGGPTSDTARTQLELNQMGRGDRDDAEKSMQAALARVLAAAKEDPAQVKRVQSAQAAWEAYRVAQQEALYGCEGWTHTYGSVVPMCAAMSEAAMYTRRADELSAMAVRTEGDVCGWVPVCP